MILRGSLTAFKYLINFCQWQAQVRRSAAVSKLPRDHTPGQNKEMPGTLLEPSRCGATRDGSRKEIRETSSFFFLSKHREMYASVYTYRDLRRNETNFLI